LLLINKLIFSFLYLFVFFNANAEGYVKAGDSLIWDSNNKSYTANGDVEFKNDKFIAFADKMIANYEERNNDEVFTKIELFNNVVIEFEEETFKGNYAIYTREDNIIKLVGDVSIESPTRLLTGSELIADIDNNKRILNSANNESLVEVLLENNAND
jgi:lipopolysaccharide export system protein LptA